MAAVPRCRCCWSVLFLVLLEAGLVPARPVAWSPTSQELRSLQDLLERLKEKVLPGEKDAPEVGTPDYGGAGEEDSEEEDGAPLDPHLLPPPPPPAPDALQALPDDVRLAEAQWRDFLASPKRRRHFSGCFGARLARIGSHTGLGCSNYKTRPWRKSRS